MRVVWTEEALTDQESILRYIAKDSLSAATTLFQRFDEAAQVLAEQPLIGKVSEVPPLREFVVHSRFRLLYEVDQNNNTVNIVSLLHTSRQWPKP
jgi:addiction module RelE/StbE family toxin